jgi:hypothetical protein
MISVSGWRSTRPCAITSSVPAELVGRKIDRDISAPTLAQFQAAWERLIQLDDAIAEVEAVRSDGMLLRSQFAARATVIEGRRLVLGVLLWGDAVVAPVGHAAGELSSRERSSRASADARTDQW